MPRLRCDETISPHRFVACKRSRPAHAWWLELWERYAPSAKLVERTTRLAETAPTIEQPKIVRSWLAKLARNYRRDLIAALVVCGVIKFRREFRRRWGWAAALILFLFSFNFASCFEIAVFHTLDVVRYRTVQLLFTLLAQTAGVVFGVEFLLEVAGRIFRSARWRELSSRRLAEG